MVVADRDYMKWADVLIALWRDRVTYNAMSANAAETVRQAFTIEHVAGQFEDCSRTSWTNLRRRVCAATRSALG